MTSAYTSDFPPNTGFHRLCGTSQTTHGNSLAHLFPAPACTGPAQRCSVCSVNVKCHPLMFTDFEVPRPQYLGKVACLHQGPPLLGEQWTAPSRLTVNGGTLSAFECVDSPNTHNKHLRSEQACIHFTDKETESSERLSYLSKVSQSLYSQPRGIFSSLALIFFSSK